MLQLKLGKLPARVDLRTLKLKSYLAQLPSIPTTAAWYGKVPDWLMLLNDTLGDCTCAAAGHQEMLWTSEAGSPFTPLDSDILAMYRAVSWYNPLDPNTDNGANMLDVLNYWRQVGLAGRKITAYAQVDPTNLDHVKASIAFFGGLYFGVQLPTDAMSTFMLQQPWSNTAISTVDGGHALMMSGFDEDGPECITWGKRQKMSWPWFVKNCDEAYCPLSREWITQNSVAPSGLNFDTLQADIRLLN